MITYEVSRATATVRMDRPEAMNALTPDLKVGLRDALRRAADDDDVRCVVLTGSGRAFCAGQDLRSHAELLQAGHLDELWKTVPDHYVPIARTLATMPKPVIAAVNGTAAGAGMSMACACDLRVVSRTAAFATAFADIGLPADTGMSWTLPRIVGPARARELLLLPRRIDAEEAYALGLATQVVEPDDLMAAALELAERLANGPTLAYASIKRELEFSATHGFAESLDFEGEQMREVGSSADHADAVASFLAKERPTFSGR